MHLEMIVVVEEEGMFVDYGSDEEESDGGCEK